MVRPALTLTLLAMMGACSVDTNAIPPEVDAGVLPPEVDGGPPCTPACPLDLAHGASACIAGRCSLTCDPGFADCDANEANGCEADLGRPETCGACATRCTEPEPLCETETGARRCVSSCGSGLTPCDTSCVDTATDVSHCGACGAVCDPAEATGACVAGRCEIESCSGDFGDCNADATDGCEQSLTTLTDCGACGTACSLPNASGTSCDTGTCEIDTCAAGFDDCNGDRTDGCETDTESDRRNCGGCGIVCAGACTPGGCLLETACNGMDDNGNGIIDEGTVCPCPVAHRTGHTYMFCNSSVNWTTARDQCAGRGYALVTIDDAAENTFVSTTAVATSSSNRWWMGFNDRAAEGTWVWVGAAATGTYVGWVGDEPNNAGCCGGEDCGELDAAGGWVDTGCGDSNYFVCEAD